MRVKPKFPTTHIYTYVCLHREFLGLFSYSIVSWSLRKEKTNKGSKRQDIDIYLMIFTLPCNGLLKCFFFFLSAVFLLFDVFFFNIFCCISLSFSNTVDYSKYRKVLSILICIVKWKRLLVHFYLLICTSRRYAYLERWLILWFIGCEGHILSIFQFCVFISTWLTSPFDLNYFSVYFTHIPVNFLTVVYSCL